MPAVLATWGCDEAMWSKVRAKSVLVQLAADGDEAAGRERIALLRRSPSIAGDLAMPPQFAACGGDEALWEQVRSKHSTNELCASGDEEAVRARVASLRVKIRAEAEAAAATAARRKQKKERKGSKWAKKAQRRADGGLLPEELAAAESAAKRQQWLKKQKVPGLPLSERGYSLAGELPDSVDVGAVEALLKRRFEAKKAKDYDAADEMQDQLLAMGVGVNDRRRTYFDSKSGWSYKS